MEYSSLKNLVSELSLDCVQFNLRRNSHERARPKFEPSCEGTDRLSQKHFEAVLAPAVLKSHAELRGRIAVRHISAQQKKGRIRPPLADSKRPWIPKACSTRASSSSICSFDFSKSLMRSWMSGLLIIIPVTPHPSSWMHERISSGGDYLNKIKY